MGRVVISLCVPTRGRPARFKQMLDSARATAAGKFEVVAYLDHDDEAEYEAETGVVYARGRRPLTDHNLVQMSGLWTRAWERASGDIAMLAADDIVFETGGWDEAVEAEFARVPDRILMVSTRNGQDDRPLLPFVSREWIDAVGFTPDDLQGWFADEWIWSMAAEVGRAAFLPGVTIRHNQYGSDSTYEDAQEARMFAGGLPGMRNTFYSIPQVERRDALVGKLRAAMDPSVRTVPDPAPRWLEDALGWAAQAREHARLIREETLVVVHCYAGDRDVVKNAMPLFLHHGTPVLVLSPEDAPVKLRGRGVTCAQAGRAGYFGQVSLDRQRAHLELLLEHPQRFFLLNDSDSACLDPVIPRYLYEQAAAGTVFSNEVSEWRPHPSPYPKIAMQPPYFLSRESVERMLAVPRIEAHPITPYIDWYMVALTCEAGLAHRTFPDGASFPAWRRSAIPETQQLGHDFVHRNDPDGTMRGDLAMARRVQQGVVFVHSVKHPEVLSALVQAHAGYVGRGSPPVVPAPEVGGVVTVEELAFSMEHTLESTRGGMADGDSIRV